jgi:hypothetical protein
MPVSLSVKTLSSTVGDLIASIFIQFWATDTMRSQDTPGKSSRDSGAIGSVQNGRLRSATF